MNSKVNQLFKPIFAVMLNYFDKLGMSFLINDTIEAITIALKSPRKKQIAFLLAFDKWVQDGAKLLDAILELKKAAARMGKKGEFNYLAACSIEEALKNGKKVSEGMEGVFSRDLIALFRVGEDVDRVSSLFSEYMTQEDERQRAYSQGRNKLIYPSLLLSLIVGLLLVIAYYGLPYSQSQGIDVNRFVGLPKITILLAQYVGIVMPYLSFTLFLLISFYLLTKNYYVNKIPYLPSRKSLDKFFPFSIHKEFTAMRIIQNIALLTNLNLSTRKIVLLFMKTATPYEFYYYNKIYLNTTSKEGTIDQYFNIGLLNDEVFQVLCGIAKQKGEQAKINAIMAASRDSGDCAVRKVNKSLFWIKMGVWGLFIIIGLITVFGMLLAGFQAKNFITLY